MILDRKVLCFMAILYNPGIITNRLVMCLDAANIKSYPGTGTAWSDLSGNGNTGTLTNGPVYNSGNGGYISFDGSNDYAITTTSLYNPTTFPDDNDYQKQTDAVNPNIFRSNVTNFTVGKIKDLDPKDRTIVKIFKTGKQAKIKKIDDHT